MGIGPSIKAPDELTRPHTKKERAHLLDPGLLQFHPLTPLVPTKSIRSRANLRTFHPESALRATKQKNL